jgi:hypothetical protein
MQLGAPFSALEMSKKSPQAEGLYLRLRQSWSGRVLHRFLRLLVPPSLTRLIPICIQDGDRGAQALANGGVLEYVGVRQGAGNEGIHLKANRYKSSFRSPAELARPPRWRT